MLDPDLPLQLTIMQMVSLSPLMSNFGALLEGLITVRGMSKIQHLYSNRSMTDSFTSFLRTISIPGPSHFRNGQFPKNGSFLLEPANLADVSL